MQKILKVIIAIITALTSILIYFFGKKDGKQEIKNEQLKEENKIISNEIKNVEKINKIETNINLASDDDLINGLYKWTAKNDK